MIVRYLANEPIDIPPRLHHRWHGELIESIGGGVVGLDVRGSYG